MCVVGPTSCRTGVAPWVSQQTLSELVNKFGKETFN